MTLYNALPIFLVGFTSIPLAFALNALQAMRNPILVLIAGVSALILAISIPYFFKNTNPPKHDTFYYVWSIFTFSSIIDVVVALENDGIIGSCMSFYLKEGEPYLQTAHGTYICYWDGFGHFAMYIVILSADAYNQRFRSGVLYWAGSIGHSMIVFLIGNFVGKFGVKWGVLLNIPYLSIPFSAGYKMLSKKSEDASNKPMYKKSESIWKRPIDFIFVMYFVLAITIACFRTAAVLGCLSEVTKGYIKSYEPYLTDPTQYPKIQMLVYLFYFVPFYVCAINSLINCSGQSWISDWSLIHAGAAAQAQVSHIGSSLHHMTEPALRVPNTAEAQVIFWMINLVLLIIPQMFAYRCYTSGKGRETEKGSPSKNLTNSTNDDNRSGSPSKNLTNPTNDDHRSYNTRSKTRMSKKDI